MFTQSPVAARLSNRAENFKNYEAGVRRHYPEEKFGGEEGGLCDEIKDAVLNLLRNNQGKEMQEKQKIFKEEAFGKNATPEYTKVFSDEKSSKVYGRVFYKKTARLMASIRNCRSPAPLPISRRITPTV